MWECEERVLGGRGRALSCWGRMLMRCAGAGGVAINAVDIFDVSSGRWTTAALSVARYYLAATSLLNQGLAIFAGGYNGAHVYLFWLVLILQDGVMRECEGRVLRGRRRALRCWGRMLMRCAGAGGGVSNAVDIFNATSGRWTTAALSVARGGLAATSLPNQGLAVFAGGTTCWFVFFDFELLILRRWCDVGV